MAFTSGQWGPDTFIDSAGNTTLVGATVTAPGYTCSVDSLGNLTITGPAVDALVVTVTPADGDPYTVTVRVLPLVAELAANSDVSTGDAARQPLNSDLTAIAALSSGTAGVLSTDGSGWIRKSYSAVKTALGLVKADVGLGNVDNTADTAKPISTATQSALDLKLSIAAASGAYGALPRIAATVSASGAAVVSKHNPVDATAAARTISLPTGQSEGTTVSVEKVDNSTNTVSITGNIRGNAATTITLAWYHETLTLTADSAGSWWPVSGHKTKSSLDGAYNAKNAGAKVANLYAAWPSGVVIAHRNGLATMPENTLLAARACVAAGIPVIQINASTLADGTVGCFHDATVDRTTTATGNVVDHHLASYSQLVLDPATYTGPGFANITGPPLLQQFLDEFGGQVTIMIELMDFLGINTIRDAIVARGLQDSVIVTSRVLTYLPAFVAAGIPCMYVDDVGTGKTPAELVAAGMMGICVKSSMITGTGVTQATINALRAVGLKIEMHTVLRKTDFDFYTGIDYVASDDPIYVQSVLYATYKHRLTTDPFDRGMFYPGMIPGRANANVTTYKDADAHGRGNILSGGRWQNDGGNSGVSLWQMLGPLCPLSTGQGTLAFSLSVDTADTTTSSWFAIFISALTDTSFNDGAALTAANSGYQFLVRQTGNLEHNRIDAGVATAGATQATAALVTSSVATFTLQITSTQLILTRTDGVYTPLTITHSTYRGGYVHWGTKYNTGNGRYSIKDVTWTPG